MKKIIICLILLLIIVGCSNPEIMENKTQNKSIEKNNDIIISTGKIEVSNEDKTQEDILPI